jgi:hypothetical protein
MNIAKRGNNVKFFICGWLKLWDGLIAVLSFGYIICDSEYDFVMSKRFD